MSRGDVVLGKSLRDFDSAQRANVAIEVSAFGNAVDVRTEQNRFKRIIAAGATADEIARGVDRSIEFRRSH